eukprot:jgi/Botrbrau1/4293/Bobra.0390s0033.1
MSMDLIWECQLCGRKVAVPIECNGCHAMLYCSDKHRRIHLQQGHAEECERMGLQMLRAVELATSPFTFRGEGLASSGNGALPDGCELLKQLGLHGKGLWQHQCTCSQSHGAPVGPPWQGTLQMPSGLGSHQHDMRAPNPEARPQGTDLCPVPLGTAGPSSPFWTAGSPGSLEATGCLPTAAAPHKAKDHSPVEREEEEDSTDVAQHVDELFRRLPSLATLSCLPSSAVPCLRSRAGGTQLPSDWRGYYKGRGLPLDSPIALLLDAPLTVLHALSLTALHPTLPSSTAQKPLVIHCLGADREVGLWPVWGELAACLPNTDITMVFVGPAGTASLAPAYRRVSYPRPVLLR